MTDKAISPLRRRMIEDMTIRKLAPKTQASYIRAVSNFTAFLGRSPDQASAEDLRRYQLHLAARGVSVPSQNATVTALRFFFTVTLGRSRVTDRMPFVREPRRLPVVLSPEEVARLLDAAPGLKYQAALSVAYGPGLRASEVISLKVCDITATAWSSGSSRARAAHVRRNGGKRAVSGHCWGLIKAHHPRTRSLHSASTRPASAAGRSSESTATL